MLTSEDCSALGKILSILADLSDESRARISGALAMLTQKATELPKERIRNQIVSVLKPGQQIVGAELWRLIGATTETEQKRAWSVAKEMVQEGILQKKEKSYELKSCTTEEFGVS